MKSKYLLLGLIFFIGLISVWNVNAALTDNVYSYWNLNEAATGNAINSITGSLNLTQTSTTVTTGIISNGRTFTNSVLTSTNTTFAGFTSSSFSVGCWIKQNTSVDNDYAVILDKQATSNPWHGWRLFWRTGSVGAVFSIRGGTDVYANGVTNINDANWHFLVGTYNNSNNNVSIYIDGTSSGYSVTSPGADYSNTKAFGIGRESSGVGQFGGTIDECFLYNRTLTSSEIQQLYNSGAGLTYPFTLPSYYSITGTIKYNSTALANATIILLNETSKTIISNTTSNSTGGYYFSGAIYPQITNNSVWSVWAVMSFKYLSIPVKISVFPEEK